MLNEKSIEEFLKEYGRSRVIIETSVRAVLKRAAEYEEVFKKDFFDFTKDEILQMYAEMKAISSRSLQNTNLVLSHAAKWFLYHTGDRRVIEEYSNITKEDIIPYVVKRELISLQELIEIEGQLLNSTDVAIVHGLFLGLGSDWMKELTFLSPSNISKKEWKIYLKTGKIIPINHIDYQIFQEAFNEKELISYNMIEQKVTSVKGEIYKVRGNTLYANDDIKDQVQLERRYRYVQRRMREFNKYIDINLTPKWLNMSGLWYYLQQAKEQLGIEDFRTFLSTDEAKKICVRYGFSERFYTQTVLDKFKNYL